MKKKFKEFILPGEKKKSINILNKAKSALHSNFVFDAPRSEDYAIHTANAIDCTGCFLSHNLQNPIAFVWLVATDDRLYISNITPKKPGALSEDEFNNILDNFVSEVLKEDV